MKKIVISAGHGKYVDGAEGPEPWGLNEFDENKRVVHNVAKYLEKLGAEVDAFVDSVSTNPSDNLETIVAYHNDGSPLQPHDLDVSVHFNSYTSAEANGTEVFSITLDMLAEQVCEAICEAGGFTNRGAKDGGGLYFCNHTAAPSLLIEVCFVTNERDCDLYRQHCDVICEAIAAALVGDVPADFEPIPLARFKGKCSWFGGPSDLGVAADEGLAFLYDVDDAPQFFLDEQPAGTTGLARRLDPETYYVACRWDYNETPKDMLAEAQHALVIAKKTGRKRLARPADWGPHADTDRVADISPGLMEDLGIETDDEIEVIYPAPRSK
jgi:hypothetical protein